MSLTELKPPKVSICIPAYNQTHLLNRSLLSIFEQNFQDYEVVITDDSNSDIVRNFLNEHFSAMDHIIHYHRNSPALGQARNMNSGISKARGELIKILHHDDWFESPDSLAGFVALLTENPNASIGVACSRNINVETFEQIKFHRPKEDWIAAIELRPELLVCANYIGSPSATIFRRVQAHQLFDPELEWNVDLDGYVKLLKQSNGRIAFSEHITMNIGESNLRISRRHVNDKAMHIREFIYFLKKWQIGALSCEAEIMKKAAKLFRRYHIRSLAEVNDICQPLDLPDGLDQALYMSCTG